MVKTDIILGLLYTHVELTAKQMVEIINPSRERDVHTKLAWLHHLKLVDRKQIYIKYSRAFGKRNAIKAVFVYSLPERTKKILDKYGSYVNYLHYRKEGDEVL